jgi:hypothetical protein
VAGVATLPGMLPGLVLGSLSDREWGTVIVMFAFGTAINTVLYKYLFQLLWVLQGGLRHGHLDN